MGLLTDSGCILVVDDDPSVREMLAEYLRSHGFSVAVAIFFSRGCMKSTVLAYQIVSPIEGRTFSGEFFSSYFRLFGLTIQGLATRPAVFVGAWRFTRAL